MCAQGYTLAPPQAFWAVGGSPCMPWVEWKAYFLNYIETLDSNGKMKAGEKKGIFLHSLGPEELKAFNQLPRTESDGDRNVFDKAVSELLLFFLFSPKVCIGNTRYKFFQRKQLTD